MDAQLTRTSGPLWRRLRRWISRAINSLPVPVSPKMSTEASVGATRSIWLQRAAMAENALHLLAGSPGRDQRLPTPAMRMHRAETKGLNRNGSCPIRRG